MSILSKLAGLDVLPTVQAVLDDAKSVSNGGNFSKVVTSTEEYYYLTASQSLIETKPEDFQVVKSTKHDAFFIVPAKSESTFSKIK